MDQGSQRVMESVLKVIDEYDLYGQVSCGDFMGERGFPPLFVWRPVCEVSLPLGFTPPSYSYTFCQSLSSACHVQVAYPKHHTQGDISDIYLLVTSTKGVFVNAALQVSASSQPGAGQPVACLGVHVPGDAAHVPDVNICIL